MRLVGICFALLVCGSFAVAANSVPAKLKATLEKNIHWTFWEEDEGRECGGALIDYKLESIQGNVYTLAVTVTQCTGWDFQSQEVSCRTEYKENKGEFEELSLECDEPYYE